MTSGSYVRKPYTATWRGPLALWDSPLDECTLHLDSGTLVTTGTRTAARDQARAAIEIERLRDAARARYRDLPAAAARHAVEPEPVDRGSAPPDPALVRAAGPREVASPGIPTRSSGSSTSSTSSTGRKSGWGRFLDWLR